ncbi:MAG: homoserine dehydrogenase [Flaviaesturariibacter sp.]|nr:homoserine dehydrogenase [Flaviaesturariibacter sp.]
MHRGAPSFFLVIFFLKTIPDMSGRKLTIGLFGFGVVGEGIYNVLQQASSLQATIKKICIKHPGKKRAADPNLFTTDAEALLNDPGINLIVELIDDADDAFIIVSTALRNGKDVVSANKKMIAEHLPDLLALQAEHGTSLLYEASVCGSIPIIRNLEEYYDNDLLDSITGIVNGSTNFILTKMAEDGLAYKDALLQAQQLGFAESNPTLDVDGYDALNKLTILLAHTYGVAARPTSLLFKGISQLHPTDATYAATRGYKIKLAAQVRRMGRGQVAAQVLPQFVKPDSQLFGVRNEYNGVIIESHLADQQFLYGKGAGRYPTSSAVLSDIAALRYQYKYEYRKLHSPEKYSVTQDYYLNVYVSFNNWSEVSKWDFESIDEFHSTQERQYLAGTIHVEKLMRADWFQSPAVSLIVMPDGLVRKDAIALKSIKKISLQLGGIFE